MSFIDSFLTALAALSSNVMRSVLTVLGIIIGVAAVIIMIAVGAGAEARMEQVISSLGSNLIFIVPGESVSGGVSLGRGTLPTLTEGDCTAIEEEIPTVKIAAPGVIGSGQVVHGNENWLTGIFGMTPAGLEAREWKLRTGRLFSADEISGAAKFAILGHTVVEKLFANQEPLGARIRLNRVPFEVIGTMHPKGETPLGRDQDDGVFIPITTAKKRVIGGRHLGGKLINMIIIKVVDAGAVSTTVAEVRDLLRQRHGLSGGQKDDFSIRNLAEFLEARAKTSRAMSLLLAVVASVSLIVGGIVIMNIMLVSVTERTREIGVRMAVGAESKDILAQFLIESVTLSLIGGVIGIVMGLGGSIVIADIGNWPTVIKPASIVLAFGFATAVGIFFGFYPARKASRLNPMEALRYE
jgi:putative ABC transport system permease protein